MVCIHSTAWLIHCEKERLMIYCEDYKGIHLFTFVLVTASHWCFGSGDPHYNTFDRYMIHFMGICQYIVAESTAGPDFLVTVRDIEINLQLNLFWNYTNGTVLSRDF